MTFVLGLAVAPPPAALARARFDTRVLARIPDPGLTSLTVLGPDRTIYGGSFFPPSGNGGDGVPSKVFAWTPEGVLKRTYVVRGQDLSQDHGVQAALTDARGRVFLLDKSPARVLVLDPATGAQSTYATVPDLRPCAGSGRTGCSATTTDNAAEPDYAAWGPDGSMYITDDTQATIFRIPPGGGAAVPWLTDPRFDAILFGLTGLALTPDRRALAFTTVGSSPTVDPMAASGKLMEVALLPDGSPGALRTRWTSGTLEAPDGFAFSAAGNAYVALLGPAVDQVVEIARDGREVARFPTAADNRAADVPFDSPSSVIFDRDRLIVTNAAYFSGDRSHQVLFDVAAGERGAPVFVPAATPAARSVVHLRVSPRLATAGRPVRVWIHALLADAGGQLVPVPTGTVARVAGGRIVLDADGRGHVRVTPHRVGAFHVRVAVPGARTASRAVRVRAAGRRHRSTPQRSSGAS